jgi:lipopolysaccharide export LptBFGC system permease protein LptF
MRASGLSYWRILSPIYVMAALAALLAMGNREFVVPTVEQMTASDIQVWTGTEKRSQAKRSKRK